MTYEHTYKGKFRDSKVDMIVDMAVEKMLERVGEKSAERLKAKTREHDWVGRLTDSITWRTRKKDGGMGNGAEPRDLVSEPKMSGVVHIGTAAPYAFYRENGAGPHSHITNSEFIPRMKEWFKEKIGEDPDDGGGGQFHFWMIVKKIQQGQDAVPFLAPSYFQIVRIAEQESGFAAFGRNVK